MLAWWPVRRIALPRAPLGISHFVCIIQRPYGIEKVPHLEDEQEVFWAIGTVQKKARMKEHSQGRASLRYQLEQYEVDWLLKRVRRFFQENQWCPGNDIIVLEQQDHNKFRLAVFVKGEWVSAVYHRRYCIFVTFLPPEGLDDLALPATHDNDTEVPSPSRVETHTGVHL